jgi:hypothetical protein
MKLSDEYPLMKKLLIEKRYLQHRIRQVDRELRALENLRPGLGSLIRVEIKES